MSRKSVSGMMVTLLLIGILTLAFNIQPAKSEEKTWTVDDDGPADFHTIEEAINAANQGDTIYVYSGTYYEHLIIAKNNLKLIGEARESTIIHATEVGGPGYSRRLIGLGKGLNGVVIRGFTLKFPKEGLNNWVIHGARVTNSVIAENIIADSSHGIYLIDPANNTIRTNFISNVGDSGIVLKNSGGDNKIYENTIKGSGVYGVQIRGQFQEGPDKFYHNNFIYNGIDQVFIADDPFDAVHNAWDDGYPSGGNYWRDYYGQDRNRDGIGDAPYIIDENNQDNYPLMERWKEAIHNIAVLDAAASINDAYAGWIVDMSVTVKNEGDFFEIFDVTAYSDENPIGTQTISLASKENMTLTFSWNTSGVTPGNYTIRAEATIVPNEINIEDNLFVDEIVRIHMPGDIDGDSIVNIYDVVMACSAYGSREGDPNWNPLADLAPPYGLINIYDIVTITFHFGETYP